MMNKISQNQVDKKIRSTACHVSGLMRISVSELYNESNSEGGGFIMLKKKYARMFSQEIPKLGLQYMIDKIVDMTSEEALRENQESYNSIWVPVPEGLYDKWVKDLYVGRVEDLS